MMIRFNYVSYAQEVMFAPGALTRLNEALAKHGWQKLMLCTSRSLRSEGHVRRIESSVGEKLVAVFDQVQPHVQDIQVNEAMTLARHHDIDAVIGLGGGSPIGMAKAVGFQMQLPIIAVPSTYAGSEMTPVYGITHTDEDPPRKFTVSDPKIVPNLVVYDPDITLDLPPTLTASTGINALAHCIEALYSKTRNALSSATAADSIRHINAALLKCYQDGKNQEARTVMLLGSHLAGFSLASVSMGLHHGLCHVLGGSANIPHGIANAIILPHAIAFNADATAKMLIPAAEAMNVPENGSGPEEQIDVLGQRISELIRKMDLPQRLRDVRVNQSDLSRLAEIAFQNRTVQNNPKPIVSVAQLEALLQAAW